MLSNRSRGCQTLMDLRRFYSNTLMLQAYWLTDIDEMFNPLFIEIWYRTLRRFSILDGIEAIRSVPKKYRTQHPDLALPMLFAEISQHLPVYCSSFAWTGQRRPHPIRG